MKRHIHWNKVEPSSEQISSLKNFDEVLSGTPNAAPKRWPYVVAAATVVIGLVWIGSSIQNNLSDSNHGDSMASDVQSENSNETYTPAALHLYDFEWEEFEILPNQNTTIITDNGSVISVPENAFTRATSDNPVTVRFTDYYHPAKVFCSGIPMHYDSAGTTYHFQSAGMIAIEAVQNGEPLSLDKGKELDVSIPTFNTNDGFNTYALNEDGKWGYQNSSQPCSNYEMLEKHGLSLGGTGTSAGASDEFADTVERLEYPEKPKLANKDNYRFHLDVDPAEFPELAIMEDVLFEATDPRFSYSCFQKTWDNVDLIRRNNGYTMVLTSGKKEERFLVYPVLNQSEFDLAMVDYKNRCTEIDEQNKQRLQELAAHENFKNELERSRENARVGFVSASSRVIGSFITGMDQSTMYRSFMMPSLGVVNCDTPLSFPVGRAYPVEFVYMEDDHKVPSPQVMLIEMDDRTYYSYVRADFDNFRIRPRKNNLVFGASVDGSLVIGTQSELEMLDHNKLTEIVLQRVPEEIKTMDELELWVDALVSASDQEF